MQLSLETCFRALATPFLSLPTRRFVPAIGFLALAFSLLGHRKSISAAPVHRFGARDRLAEAPDRLTRACVQLAGGRDHTTRARFIARVLI